MSYAYNQTPRYHQVGISPNPSQPYATQDFLGAEYDNHYTSLVGWDPVDSGYRIYFSRDNIRNISEAITRILRQAGHSIVVTDQVIGGVMSDVMRNNDPVIGDIYTRYVIPNTTARDDVGQMNQRVINTIVNTILDEYETTKINQSLSVWTNVLGDFNTHGLRAHPILRTKENDYIKGVFMENY